VNHDEFSPQSGPASSDRASSNSLVGRYRGEGYWPASRDDEDIDIGSLRDKKQCCNFRESIFTIGRTGDFDVLIEKQVQKEQNAPCGVCRSLRLFFEIISDFCFPMLAAESQVFQK
jgi:hypothetical protein